MSTKKVNRNIGDVEFVKCPYCDQNDESNNYPFLHWKHLKTAHDKTIDDVRKEFPDWITTTLTTYQKQAEHSKNMRSLKNDNSTKTVKCCIPGCDVAFEVNINTSTNYSVCELCKSKGYKSPIQDKITQSQKEGMLKAHGVLNASQIKEVQEKKALNREMKKEEIVVRKADPKEKEKIVEEVEIDEPEKIERFISPNSNHLIADLKYVRCPYCNAKLNVLKTNHLKIHGKVFDDVRNEFPDLPTMTYDQYLKNQERGKKANENSSRIKGETKIVKCITPSCKNEMVVTVNASNTMICDECREKRS